MKFLIILNGWGKEEKRKRVCYLENLLIGVCGFIQSFFLLCWWQIRGASSIDCANLIILNGIGKAIFRIMLYFSFSLSRFFFFLGQPNWCWWFLLSYGNEPHEQIVFIYFLFFMFYFYFFFLWILKYHSYICMPTYWSSIVVS